MEINDTIKTIVVNEVIIKNRSKKDVAQQYNLCLSTVKWYAYIYGVYYNSEVIAVNFGNKDQPYWENEMDYWTGSVGFDNKFRKLKYEDVKHEKTVKVNEFIS